MILKPQTVHRMGATPFLVASLDLATAAEVLGFTRRRMRMAISRLFPNAARAAPRGVWEVPRADVEAILELANNLPEQEIADEDCVSLSEILRYWPWSPAEIVGLLVAAKSGSLVPCARITGAKGIVGLVFKKSEASKWHDRHLLGDADWMTLPQFAARHNIPKTVAYQLVSIGFLDVERVPSRNACAFRVSQKIEEKFLREYVFATVLADKVGVSSSPLRKLLQAGGIEPISGPSVDGAKRLIYRRTEELETAISRLGKEEVSTFKLE